LHLKNDSNHFILKPLCPMKINVCLAAVVTLFFSCSPKLLPPKVERNSGLEGYSYAVVPSTGTKNSTLTSIYNGYGGSTSQSANPRDIIAGALLKKGYTILPEVNSEQIDKTFIVNYGESGKRKTGLGGYTLEVTISFVSAKSYKPLCSCVAEGQGSTEADDIRIAISRCLNSLLN